MSEVAHRLSFPRWLRENGKYQYESIKLADLMPGDMFLRYTPKDRTTQLCLALGWHDETEDIKDIRQFPGNPKDPDGSNPNALHCMTMHDQRAYWIRVRFDSGYPYDPQLDPSYYLLQRPDDP